jgi:glutathione synthase
MKKIKLGVVMDPIESIHVKKDSTLAMMLEAQQRHWEIYYIQQKNLFVRGSDAYARMQSLKVFDNEAHWFEKGDIQESSLNELDVILMRKDPPFNMEYIYTTYLLELAERQGVLVINSPQGLRDANEKAFITWFPQCIAPTLISQNMHQLKSFLQEHQDVVFKPLDSMGGQSIFKLTAGDMNTQVVLEMLTQNERSFIMAQKFIPEVIQGDKRILIINGEAVPYALARIPAKGEFRGNLAAGGNGVGVKITERDQWICAQLKPILQKKGLLFVGIDVIGDYLTEINVTSPTCIREIDRAFNINIGAEFLTMIEQKLMARE